MGKKRKLEQVRATNKRRRRTPEDDAFAFMEAAAAIGEDCLDEDEDEDDVEAMAEAYLSSFQATLLEDLKCSKVEDRAGHLIALSERTQEGSNRFMEWMLSPVTLTRFQLRFFERRPLAISRPQNRAYFDGWFSKTDIEELLDKGALKYQTNVDVTKVEDGERKTLNGEGVAKADEVWKRYGEGCSVRVLHPQRWSNPLWLMLSTLETYWGTFVGANAYLTPPGSQGFSPHWDDIDAFVLQLEGHKRWRLYPPREAAEALPRVSSKNFKEDEIGEEILDVVLEPGDILYMPRGTIHQASTLDDSHSLHVTVSVNQCHTWSDFLELMVPQALKVATEDHIMLRQSLPPSVSNFMGVVHSDRMRDPHQLMFLEHMMHCCYVIFNSMQWHAAIDNIAANFMRGRLPLFPSGEAGQALLEKRLDLDGRQLEEQWPGAPPVGGPHGAQVNGTGSHHMAQPSTNGNGLAQEAPSPSAAKKRPLIVFATRVRLVAPQICRLVIEDSTAALYHMLHNSRTLHNSSNVAPGEDMDDEDGEMVMQERGKVVYPLEYAPAIEQLSKAYPEPIAVSSLVLEHKKDSLRLVKDLLAIGIIVVVQ